MAKTFGKHLWDKNKHKIISKGIQFGKNLINKKVPNVGKYISPSIDKLENHLKENDYDIQKVSSITK